MKQLLWYLLAGTRGGLNRIRILEALLERPYNAHQLSEELELDYRTMRHHLDVLTKNHILPFGRAGSVQVDIRKHHVPEVIRVTAVPAFHVHGEPVLGSTKDQRTLPVGSVVAVDFPLVMNLFTYHAVVENGTGVDTTVAEGANVVSFQTAAEHTPVNDRVAIRAVEEVGLVIQNDMEVGPVRSTRNQGSIDIVNEIDCEVVGVDYRMSLVNAARALPNKEVQGNLDPSVLFGAPEDVARRTKEILDSLDNHNRLIFNLGHGIQPQTPIESVHAVVDTVHKYRS